MIKRNAFFIFFSLLFILSFDVFAIDNIADENIIAATLILEAGGEDHIYSMVAVYEVIRNRAALHNVTLKEVVLQPRQFSCWNDIPNRLELYNIAKQHSKFKQALRIVRENRNTNITHGATMFHAQYILPYWHTEFEKTFVIQNHIFYR